MFCIWSRTKFNEIDILKLCCLSLHFLESIKSSSVVCRPLGCKVSEGCYMTFESIFVKLCRCRSLFFCVSQESETSLRDSREGRSLSGARPFPALRKYAKTNVCSKVPTFFNLPLKQRTLELWSCYCSCSFEPHNSVLIEANLNLHYLNETICRNDSLIVVNCYKSNSLEQLILVPHFAQIPTHYLGHICLACTLLCRSRDLIRKSAGGRTGEHKWNAGVFVSV